MPDAATNTRRWFDEVWNRGNLDVVDEYMESGTVIHDAGAEPGDISDPAVFKGMAAAMRSAFPDIRLEIHDVIVQGEKTVLRFTASGTHKGNFLSVAPTGRAFSISGMAWGEWRGDKLVRAWNNIDLLSLFAQIGAVKRP